MSTTPRLVEVRQNVLKQNDMLARALRDRFREAGVYVVSLVSSPGAGKTTLSGKDARGAAAAIAAWPRSSATSQRRTTPRGWPEPRPRSGRSPPARFAISTPRWSSGALAGWDLAELDLLFIENVGNLVCPASYDLGEDLRVVLISVTEGEDKPLKYPTIFNTADVAVITKVDLAEAVEFDLDAARENIQAVAARHAGLRGFGEDRRRDGRVAGVAWSRSHADASVRMTTWRRDSNTGAGHRARRRFRPFVFSLARRRALTRPGLQQRRRRTDRCRGRGDAIEQFINEIEIEPAAALADRIGRAPRRS